MTTPAITGPLLFLGPASFFLGLLLVLLVVLLVVRLAVTVAWKLLIVVAAVVGLVWLARFLGVGLTVAGLA